MYEPPPIDLSPKKCPSCEKFTHKWRGMEFHHNYVLGEFLCLDKECSESYENRYKWISMYHISCNLGNKGDK